MNQSTQRVHLQPFCISALALTLVLLAQVTSLRAQQLGVLSRRDDVLVFLDLTTGEKIDSVSVGRFCHEVALDTVNWRAYVPSYRGNTVHRIDVRTRAVHEFDLGGYSALHGITVSKTGKRLWVTAEDSAAVLELDADDGTVLHVWKTHAEGSHMVVTSPDEEILYVANVESGSVSIINRAMGETTVVETGPGTEGIDVSPDGREVWAASRGDRTLSIIDTSTGEVVATVRAGGRFPVRVKFQPGAERVWVLHNRGITVGVFDVRSRTLLENVTVGRRPLGLAFNWDGSRAYVSRPRDNEAVEIDTSTRKVLRRLVTGTAPDGLIAIPFSPSFDSQD